MTLAGSFLGELVQGFADLLSPKFGLNDASATHPLYVQKLPDIANGGPAHSAAVTVAPLTADPTRNQSETRLSFLLRSAGDDVRDLWEIENDLADALLGRFPLTLSSGIGVTSLDFRGGAPLGQDTGNRWLSTQNYVANHERVTAHRH